MKCIYCDDEIRGRVHLNNSAEHCHPWCYGVAMLEQNWHIDRKIVYGNRRRLDELDNKMKKSEVNLAV